MIYKNYLIPKDTVLVTSLHSLHFDKDLYENPEQFNPERFLNEDRTLYASAMASNEEDWSQFVFGRGRRACPGISMVCIQHISHMP